MDQLNPNLMCQYNEHTYDRCGNKALYEMWPKEDGLPEYVIHANIMKVCPRHISSLYRVLARGDNSTEVVLVSIKEN